MKTLELHYPMIQFLIISDIPQLLLRNIRSHDVFRPVSRKRKYLMNYNVQYSVLFCYVVPCCAMLCHVAPCCIMLCFIVLCCAMPLAMLFDVVPCFAVCYYIVQCCVFLSSLLTPQAARKPQRTTDVLYQKSTYKAFRETSEKFWKRLRVRGYPVRFLHASFREVKYGN